MIFLFVLLITVFSKYFLSLNYQFNWVDKLFTPKIASKFKYLLHNIIKILIKLRELNIVVMIIFLIINSIFISYFLYKCYINLEFLCKLYLELKHK